MNVYRGRLTVPGFKCVGNYKGDEAWVRRKHEEDMVKRLRNLDRVDEWRDKEKLQNVTHLAPAQDPHHPLRSRRSAWRRSTRTTCAHRRRRRRP